MATAHFIFISEAYQMAFGGSSTGGRTEHAEKRLSELGIAPAGRIKGERKGEVIYRPFYDPDDIKVKTGELAEIDAQLKALQEKRAALLSAKA